MKFKTRKNLLGLCDMVLAMGATYTGYLIVTKYGIFSQYPREWLGILPFHDWLTPGIIAVCVFGIGNMIASILCFREKLMRYWIPSAVMGSILLLLLICLMIILRNFYLATLELLILAMLQLFLSIFSARNINETKII